MADLLSPTEKLERRRRSMEPLAPDELAIIDELPEEMSRQIAADIIAQGVAALCTQSNEHNAAARGAGFENAEHEVLAFLGSDWFAFLVETLLDRDESPSELVQAILDQAYDGTVQVVECPEPRPVWRRSGRRRREKGYTKALSETMPEGTLLLREYDRIIQVEYADTGCILLEVPLFARLSTEVEYA